MAQAQSAQLALHVGNVGHSGGARVSARLHGVLLGRQAERIVTQRMQHIRALHAVEARKHVRADVTQRVAHVQAHTGGVGEHVLDKFAVLRQLRARLRQVARRVRGVKRAVVGPVLLPLGLDLGREAWSVAVRIVFSAAVSHVLTV